LKTPADFVLNTTRSDLYTDRYLTDLHYGKDAWFYHNLKNNNPEKHTLILYIQDFFIHTIRPFMHELTIYKKKVDGSVVKMTTDEYQASLNFFNAED